MGTSRTINLLSYKLLIPLAIFFGLAPFYPEPHLMQKIGMLVDGSLRKPIDIIDLFWHSWPIGLLVFKVIANRTPRS